MHTPSNSQNDRRPSRLLFPTVVLHATCCEEQAQEPWCRAPPHPDAHGPAALGSRFVPGAREAQRPHASATNPGDGLTAENKTLIPEKLRHELKSPSTV